MGTIPRLFMTCLTASIPLSRYTAPKIASAVAVIVTGEMLRPCDGLMFMCRWRLFERLILFRFAFDPILDTNSLA